MGLVAVAVDFSCSLWGLVAVAVVGREDHAEKNLAVAAAWDLAVWDLV